MCAKPQVLLTTKKITLGYTIVNQDNKFFQQDGKLFQHLSNNSELAEVLEKIELPAKLDFSVPVPGNFTAGVHLLLPPKLDKTGRTKYPVLFYV